jgi:hypothetical protein
MIEKSRDIPLSELYSNLQLEFISYFMRAKTYRKEFAINYKKVCDVKREKIENISSKNNLPSIFNDSHAKQRYLDKFFNESGIPNFIYKDDLIKAKMGCWDKYYFFQKGCSVKFKDGCEVLIGQINHNDKNSCIVEITDENKAIRELHYNNICRIFSEDFFKF